MVRRSLMVVALLAVASPLTAQDEWVWRSDRPDAHAPIGITTDRTLAKGAIELTYRLSVASYNSLYFLKDSLPVATTLLSYQVAPTGMTRQLHTATVAFGATDDLTLMANAEFDVLSRDHLTAGGVIYSNTIKDLGDVTATALYDLIRSGPYRAHVQLGGVIPVGNAITRAVTPFGTQALPYEMRPGGGTFAVVPGAGAEAQNEVASVGANITARVNVGRKRDYQLGNRYEANGWGGYAVNDAVSVSLGVRYQHWGGIEGGDVELSAAQDPGMDARNLGGARVDFPVGMNFVFPESSVLAGHGLSLEASFPVHHNYKGPQLAPDWGLVLGYRFIY